MKIMDDNVTRELLMEIQDHLAPKLDSYEQMLYHYLFRHSYLEGRSSVTVGIRPLRTRVGLGVGQSGSPPSEMVVMKKLRSLEDKGCIAIESRSARGTEIRVFLPKEIPGVVPSGQGKQALDIEELDFFNTPALRLQLLEREGFKCFYCLRRIAEDNYSVDHVHPQSEGGRHSYRNVVACCFECNTRKRNTEGNEFILHNYREGLLSADEYKERLTAMDRMQSGEIKPAVEDIV